MLHNFDLLSYVESRCAVARRYGKGEHLLRECPHCGAREHCSVNPQRCSWRCFKCEWAGTDPVKFVAEVENTDLGTARELILEAQLDVRRPAQLEAFLQEHEAKPALPKVVEWRSGLPAEYVPCFSKATGKSRIPTYLVERGITKETCMTYRLGWCDKGRYAGRIIIPIITGDVVTFQARATWDDAVPKYLGEPDAPLSKVLMGYDLLRPDAELWIVEGPFDKLACHQAGIPAVPLTGKQLSDAQVNLIVRLRPSKVHVMLDDDAELMVRKVAAKLAYRVETDIVLLKGGDPSDLGDLLAGQAHQFNVASRPAIARTLTKQL